MARVVGIDLGTTNSAVAAWTEDGPKLIPNALGEVLTPSAVGIDKDGQLLVGQTARDFQVVAPERCASAFKRFSKLWCTSFSNSNSSRSCGVASS